LRTKQNQFLGFNSRLQAEGSLDRYKAMLFMQAIEPGMDIG
jgi:hypothetical protein